MTDLLCFALKLFSGLQSGFCSGHMPMFLPSQGHCFAGQPYMQISASVDKSLRNLNSQGNFLSDLPLFPCCIAESPGHRLPTQIKLGSKGREQQLVITSKEVLNAQSENREAWHILTMKLQWWGSEGKCPWLAPGQTRITSVLVTGRRLRKYAARTGLQLHKSKSTHSATKKTVTFVSWE